MWKDRLRPASFKGIPFYVEEHEAEVGRRLVLNEYPLRDTPYTEDLGRRARSYNVTAYVIGNDYMTDRDALLDAIEEGGSGSLVHPYLGTKNVICQTGRMRETQSEGGWAMFTLTFIEAGQKQFPSGDPVTSDLILLKANALISAASTNFVTGMTVTGVSEWVRDNYSGVLSQAAAIFSTIRQNGGLNKQTTVSLINQAAEWVADVTDITLPSSTLLLDLDGVATRFQNIFSGVFDLAPDADTAAKNLQSFTGFTAARNGGASAQAIIADENARVSEDFIKTIAVATETKTATMRNFPAYSEAITARDGLLERLDDIAGATTDDDIYEAIRDLRSQVAEGIPGTDNRLPRLDNVYLKKSIPTLVLAYDLYEGVTREQDIIDRNNVRHPAFLSGGEGISILRDV